MKKEKNKITSILRPPIVVVLGHVDHGKTTLLDYIRQTNVAAGEAGEITQKIGAYQTKTKDSTITFIDTPGHEAFLKMRSRGASVADIAILVVSSVDGVMPQTLESIRIINEAKLPLIVALNKADLPSVNLEKVKKQLVKTGLLLEGLGGDIVSVPVSAKTGQGISDLLEMVVLLAQMQKIEADPKGELQAVIIEAKIDKGRGPVASIIIKNGTLKIGDEFFAEDIKIKVKALINDKGERIKEALPGTPVEVLGFEKVPSVGATLTKQMVTAESNLANLSQETNKQSFSANGEALLKIILKTDTLGSLEAIIASLPKEVEILDKGTGDVSESDVLLAKTTGSLILGFNINVANAILKLAETEKVKIKTYQIIYKLLEELEEVKEILANPPEEESLGKAEILAEFPFNKEKIAGSRVLEGRMAVGDKVKILRKEEEVGRTKIKSLRTGKEIINKAEMGKECGLFFDPFLDFKVGDIVISVKV